MRNIYLTFFGLIILISSCKSTYEKVRTSGDPELILKNANQYYAQKEYLKAQTLFELVISSFRGQKQAEDLYFKYAYTHYYLSDFETASQYFKNFANTFVTSKYKEESEFMAVYTIYRTSPDIKLDQTSTQKAIDGFQSFVNVYPESDRLAECNKLIDQLRLKLETKAYQQALLYYDLKSFQACLTSLENLLTDFPETKNEREIRYLQVKSAYEWAVNSVNKKQKERFNKTIELCNYYLVKFPSGKVSQEVKQIKNQANIKFNNPIYDGY